MKTSKMQKSDNQKIMETAMLTRLSIFQFNPKRQDEKTTTEVLIENNAKREAGAWIKNLINPKALAGVTAANMKARNLTYKYTLPWHDEGVRILPVTIWSEYAGIIDECRKEFFYQVEKFTDDWDTLKEEAKKALNGMYQERDYPDVQYIKNRFAFNVDYMPIPRGSDFRVQLPEKELANMRENLESQINLATENAIKDLWARLAEPVKKISEKLSDKEGIFRDSMIENLSEIVERVKTLNILKNPELDKLADEVSARLVCLNPKELREDKTARETAAKEADELFQKMKGYFNA